MKIRLTVDGEVTTATLYDSTAARDFAALLLSLTLTDYARIERIADLPKGSTERNAEKGMVPAKAGDLAYYAPWGNLAIFVEDGTGNYTAI